MDSTSISRSEQLALSFGPAEDWRPIIGYEGSYDVSNLGRVRSLERLVTYTKGLHGSHTVRGRILSPCPRGGNRFQYLIVHLCLNGQIRVRSVHHLVLETFVGPRLEGLEANHIDGNSLNNAASNLEWVTRQRNAEHATEIGHRLYGERHGKSRYTTEDVLRIRRLARSGMSAPDIIRMVGGSPTNVCRIIRRETWKHLSDESLE